MLGDAFVVRVHCIPFCIYVCVSGVRWILPPSGWYKLNVDAEGLSLWWFDMLKGL
jgi:hypothetical protein